MELYEFIKTYIARNTIIRLWKPVYKDKPYGDKVVLTEDAVMEWEIMGITQLQDIPVIHITDIVCDTSKESVNIVVKTDYEPEQVISMIDEYRRLRRKKFSSISEG